MALTKPRIIEPPPRDEVVAERGMPPVWLILATLVGDTLAAAGANATNMVVDRDMRHADAPNRQAAPRHQRDHPLL